MKTYFSSEYNVGASASFPKIDLRFIIQIKAELSYCKMLLNNAHKVDWSAF